MSRILDATCEGGTVTSQGVEVVDPVILCEGEGESSGMLVMQDGVVYYVGKTSPDLKDTLRKLVDALTEIASALSAIDAKPTGGTASAPAPAATGNVTAINTLKAQLDTLKDNLK